MTGEDAFEQPQLGSLSTTVNALESNELAARHA
jgi:hypothetical protein